MTWFHRIRLRVLAILLAGTLAVIGVLTWAAVPPIAVMGAAVITVAAMVSSATSRLSSPTCWSCGEDLSEEPEGVHGRICSSCGAVDQHRPSTRS